MMAKSLAILLLGAFMPHHCDHPHPPWGAGGTSSTGGSAGSSGTAGTSGSGGTGSVCPDSATLVFNYVSGSFGPQDPWDFTWPQPEDPNCDAQWERDEVNCVVSVDQECFYEDVNVGPGPCVAGETCVDEHSVRSSSFTMLDGGEGFYDVVFTQTRQSDGVSFTDDGEYTLEVTVP